MFRSLSASPLGEDGAYTHANTYVQEVPSTLVPVGQANLNHWTSNPTDLVYKKTVFILYY